MTTCETCGRDKSSPGERWTGLCHGEGDIDCWRARAERLQSEKDEQAAAVDVLAEDLKLVRADLDAAVGLLREYRALPADWWRTRDFLARIDATASGGNGTTP